MEPAATGSRELLTTGSLMSYPGGQTQSIRHGDSLLNIAHVFDKSGPHHGRREKERISYGEEVASLSSQYNSEGTIFLIV